MSKQVLKNVAIFLGALRINSSMNQAAMEYEADAPEGTCFGDDTHKMLPGGLKTVAFSASGFFEAEEPDKTLFEAVGVANEIITIAPSAVEGGVAFVLPAVLGEYTPIEGSVGEPAGFSLSAGAYDSLIRGILGQNGVELASDVGAGAELGALSSDQKLYAALHVFDSSGTGDQTLDVEIESDVDNGWSSPVSKLSFTQVTTTEGAELKTFDGPETDTWWRVKWTIGGTGSPSFDFAVIIGIL
jgi:hypothetical protein